MYAFFIRRPIVAICLALMILLGGLFCAAMLPIAQYPDITPPQVSITTSYPGADCNTVADSVASPIEQQMSGVSGIDGRVRAPPCRGVARSGLFCVLGFGHGVLPNGFRRFVCQSGAPKNQNAPKGQNAPRNQNAPPPLAEAR